MRCDFLDGNPSLWKAVEVQSEICENGIQINLSFGTWMARAIVMLEKSTVDELCYKFFISLMLRTQ